MREKKNHNQTLNVNICIYLEVSNQSFVNGYLELN